MEHLLPCRAEEIQGKCIDIFHENPAHQRALLADPGMGAVSLLAMSRNAS